MFSMVLSNLVYLKDVSFADDNSGKTPSITLEENKEYTVKLYLKNHEDSVIHNKKMPYDVAEIRKHNPGSPGSGPNSLEGEFSLEGKLVYRSGKYNIKIPVVTSRIEQNFRSRKPIVIKNNNYILLDEIEGKLYPKNILELEGNTEFNKEVGQFKYEVKNINIELDNLENHIYIKSEPTLYSATYVGNKETLLSEYIIDMEDLRSQIGNLDSVKINQIFSLLHKNIEDNDNNISQVKPNTLLVDGQRLDIPNDQASYMEFRNNNIGKINWEKYSNHIMLISDDTSKEDAQDALNGPLGGMYVNGIKYLKAISLSEKGTYKGILLKDGERIKIPTKEQEGNIFAEDPDDEDSVEESFSDVCSEAIRVVFEQIDTSAYASDLNLDAKKEEISKITDTKEKTNKIESILKEIYEKEIKKPSIQDTYNIETSDGIVKIKKEKLKEVKLKEYEEYKAVLNKLDESKYTWPLGIYKDKDELIKAYSDLYKNNTSTKKLKIKAKESYGVDFNDNKEYANKIGYPASFNFKTENDYMDKRIDYKFTLDGSEPTMESESAREVSINQGRVALDTSASMKGMDPDEFGPLGKMPDSLFYGKNTTIKVKAFSDGFEPSDTLVLNVKHEQLNTSNFLQKKVFFNGKYHEATIGVYDIFEQFKNCIYYDTEIMLDEVNSGPVYEKVKKKINEDKLHNFTLLDYKLLDSNGSLAKMKGDWKTDAFNDGKGNYVLNISVILNEGRDLYPIQLKSGKIAMYRVSEDGELTKIKIGNANGVRYISKEESKLILDINNNKGMFVIAQIEDDKNLEDLKKEYSEMLAFLSSKDSSLIYEKNSLEKLKREAEAVNKEIEKETNKENVRNQLNDLKKKIHELKKTTFDSYKLELLEELTNAKSPVTRVLKTTDSIKALDLAIKDAESKLDASDEEKKVAIKKLKAAVNDLKMIATDFAKQPENLADGEYEVPIQLRHFNRNNDTSMGNAAIEGLAILKVASGKQSLIFDLKGVTIGSDTGRVIKLQYFEPKSKVNRESDLGEPKNPNIIKKEKIKGFDGKEREYIQKVELPIDSDKSNPMRYIGISVDVMNGIFEGNPEKDAFQYAPVVIDYRQLKPVNGTQPNPQPDPNPQPQPNKWNVPVQLKHGYEDKNSMGSAALLPTATIEKKSNGKYEYTIKFKGIHANFGSKEFYGHLYGLKIYKDGFDSEKTEIQASKTLKDKDIVGQERDFPAEYKFTLDKLSDLVKIQVAVDAMDAIMNGGQAPYDIAGAKWKGAQNARLILDISSIPKEPNPSNPTPDLPKPDESIENAKAQLKKDLEIAKHLVNSGIAKGNSKGILERAIKKVEGVLGKSNPIYLELVSASQVLNFAILSIKDDANPNDNIKTDEKIDKGKLDGGIVDKNDDKDTKIYSVPAKLWHAYENKESMGNPAMEKDIIVKVSKNKFEYYVSFKGLSFANKYGHLWDLSVYDTGLNGSLRPAIIDKEYRDTDLEGKQRTFPKRYKFIRNGKEDKIYVKVAVDAMDAISSNQASTYDKISKGAGSQNAILVFDWSKAKEYTDNNANDENKSRISGSDRYETSALISKQYFKNADTVVLASGINSADALVSASFAKINKAPILLSSKADIPSSVENEISRLKAKNIVIVGGNSSISPAVEKKLKDAGYKVSRISGSNRYETASILAQRVRDLGGSNKAILINGEKSADALTVSSLATKSDIPVLLVNSRKIDSSVKSKLDSWNVNELLIVGGSGSIPNSIVNNIRANKKRRIAGADRFDTAIEIAKESYSNPKTVMLSNGYNAIDALSAGAVTEKAQAPILLVRKDSIPSKVRSMVDNNSSKAVFLGGVNTISSWVESSLNK